jgi:hypothetical protein
VRPRAARMRLYSSAVMLCCASNCGVTVTGSGTTAEEALVIADASILAQGLLASSCRCGKLARSQLDPRQPPRRHPARRRVHLRTLARAIGRLFCLRLLNRSVPRPDVRCPAAHTRKAARSGPRLCPWMERRRYVMPARPLRCHRPPCNRSGIGQFR